ncbi:hypothetical protein D3C76_861860 [compost metagenome]
MLGRRVDAHLRCSPETGHRSRVDDCTAALGQQQRQLILHAQPHAFDVDAHDRVELVDRTLGQFALLDLDAGVVEGIVETAVGIDHFIHQIFYIAFQRNVATHERRFAACRTDQRYRAFAPRRVHVGNHHLQAFGGKCLGSGPADTGCRACHYCHLAGKRHAHCSVLEEKLASDYVFPA